MIHKILVPTDFSKSAENATQFAIHLAKHLGASVTLYHSFYIAAIPGLNAPTKDYMDQIEADHRKEHLTRLEQIAAQYADTGLSISIKAEQGVAADQIHNFIAKEGFQLVVMGAKGLSALEKLFFGSVTLDIMEKAPCPIVAVPEKAQFKGIRKITYATMLSDKDSKVLETLVPIANAFDAELSTLHVGSSGNLRESIAKADAMSDTYVITPVKKSSFEFLVDEEIEKNIDDYLANLDTDLLVMMAREKSFWKRLFEHSHTQKLLLHSNKPLLIFREN
jgi:nucleotide-binding universal stress UspA family protein